MIDRTHELPLLRQAVLLGLSRSRLYYEPRPVLAAELAIMRRIDALHLDYPFAGSRMLRDLLRGEGVVIGREMVRTMMRRMCIEALYRRPNTSKAAPGHKIYPYLLRGLAVDRPNQVWAMDITYIPMARGFVYLAAVVDWFTRRVLTWRLSISMEVDFCIDAVEEALGKYGRPEIFNTDQGSQFTSAAFTGLPSAWTAAVPGGTTSLSSGYGGRSNTRRSICGLTTASVRRAPLSASIWFSITRYVPIRVLTHEHRITPTSTTDRYERRHEFRRHCPVVAPVGLRPPCATTGQWHTTKPTGRRSTYRRRNAVSTKPTTSYITLLGSGSSGLGRSSSATPPCNTPPV
jgi:putative transposase